MRVVIALGGNALMRRHEPMDAARQLRNVEVAARAIAQVAREHDVVITHGNGPQVGLLALQAEAYEDVKPYPLDVLGAESEGMIGYLLEQALRNEMPDSEVAALLTQVTVDADDPAFRKPSKPIGPMYPPSAAPRLRKERGWSVAADGDGVRRVVPSPEPKEIVELATIRTMVDAGITTICVGGGGIPSVVEAGCLRGVEAVVDKDLSAALLANRLGADCFVMLTDVAAVMRDFGTYAALPISHAGTGQLRAMPFAAGSMAPKVEAACRFVEAGGQRAAIGNLPDAADIVAGRAGTQVTRDGKTELRALLVGGLCLQPTANQMHGGG
jgi:carbamate kinase